MISGKSREIYEQMLRQRELYPDLSKRDYKLATKANSESINKESHLEDVALTQENAHGVPVEIARIDGMETEKYIYYIHGGGFALGEPAWGHLCAVETARKCNRHVVSVDYRLAPEFPFPMGVEDCITGYQWMLEQGIKPENITFLGESSGGNLILAVALACKERDIPLPAAICPISPVVDLSYPYPSWKEREERECVLNLNLKEEVTANYVRDEDYRNPLMSPIYGDCTGFPPVYTIVSTEEMLFDDSIKMHEKLLREGVDSRLTVWEQMWHTFYMIDVPESWIVFRDIADFFNEF